MTNRKIDTHRDTESTERGIRSAIPRARCDSVRDKFRAFVFRAFVLLTGVVLPCAAQPEPLATNAAPETASAAANEPATNAADPIVAVLLQGGDPFQFRYRTGAAGGGPGADCNGMIPVDTRSVSADIRVRGLLRLADKTPAALLQVRPDEPPVLVRKGDLLFVPHRTPAAGRRNGPTTADEPLYLLIDEIRDDCVMVAPKKNPDAIMMLR